MSRGAFIVLEGLDRCGKTTHSQKLVQWLSSKGFSSQYVRFPDRSSESGKQIDKYLRNEISLSDTEIHKLFSKNREEKKNELENSLRQGINIVVDRYSFSGVAYSSAKGSDFDWCAEAEIGLTLPDIVLQLTVPMELLTKRAGFGEERYENVEFLMKVEEQYKRVRNYSKNIRWEMIDASESTENTADRINSIALEIIEQSKSKPIQSLW